MNPAAATGEDALCPTENGTILFVTGGLATLMMTGGVATIAGRGFWRSLAGSALGYAGGLVVGAVLVIAGEELGWDGESVETLAIGGVILGHASLTTLF